MAKLPQGILGGIRGKIGGIVGTSWKGIPVIKTVPLSVANPRTAGQVAQRTKFANTVAFSKQILADIIKPLWDRFASQESGFNAFLSANISNFVGIAPAIVNTFVMCRGKMAATSFSVAIAGMNPKEATITWVDDSGEGFKLPTDEFFILKFKPGNELAEGVRSAVTRGDGQAVIQFAEAFEGEEDWEIQGAFMRADGTIVGNPFSFKNTDI